jgi:hypothetical protein
MSKKSQYTAQDDIKKGIQPFPEWPSEERASKNDSFTVSSEQEETRNISAVELFSLFTADVIRDNLEFRR